MDSRIRLNTVCLLLASASTIGGLAALGSQQVPGINPRPVEQREVTAWSRCGQRGHREEIRRDRRRSVTGEPSAAAAALVGLPPGRGASEAAAQRRGIPG